MESHEKKQNSGIIIFGIIAVLALVVAWFAFNRSGEDLVPTVASETEEAAMEAELAVERTAQAAAEEGEEAAAETRLAAARLEAKTELAIIQARVEAGEAYDAVEDDINVVEADLETAYANASADAQQAWTATKQAFTNLEEGLRDGTGDVLEFFAGVALLLEADVRVDDDTNVEIDGSVD
jgi:hypothetical protein